MFELIPAVDIKDGRCVQLVQGEPGTGDEYGDPVEAAGKWSGLGANRLHVIDLDGAFKGRQKNINSIEKIVNGLEIPVQVGGGIRSFEAAEKLFAIGVDRVFVGTMAFRDPDIFEELVSSYGRSIYVSIDASEGEVMVDGWTEGSGVSVGRACSRFEDMGVGGFLFTNIDREGLLEGVDMDSFGEVISGTDLPVIVSGGVSSIEEVLKLRDVGAEGVVVGTALYKGKIDFEEAIDILNG